MNEITISSWNELQTELFAESWNEKLGRFRSKYAFRGLSDSNYKLESRLARHGGDFRKLEKHLLRNFKKYAHRSVVEKDSIWNWLSVAQHYGLPTRLLDWTYSPFVAMHFATADIDTFNVDGVIWAVNYVKTHNILPEKLSRKLEEEGANVFTVEMLFESIKSLTELEDLSSDPFILFFEPPSIDDRIVNQFAFFSMSSDSSVVLNSWLEDKMDFWRKIVIPAKLKWEIRDKLDQANITERVLFPGLDGLTKWLARHYSPK